MLELIPVRRARPGSQAAMIARPKRRGALLASTAFTGAFAAAIAGHPTGALAACSGVNTANVLCDAANQATAGTLSTSFAGTTVVNVNPGGKIDTGGAAATVTAAGSLTFNNNDTTFGITQLVHRCPAEQHFGAITYLGNAPVTSDQRPRAQWHQLSAARQRRHHDHQQCRGDGQRRHFGTA